MATSEVIAQPQAAVRLRDTRLKLLIVLQLFVIGDYLLTILFAPQLAGTAAGRGELTAGLAEPAAVLRAGGYYLTILAGPVTALLAILGGAQVASRWPDRRTLTVTWLIAGTALCAAAFVLSLTPFGRGLASWTAL